MSETRDKRRAPRLVRRTRWIGRGPDNLHVPRLQTTKMFTASMSTRVEARTNGLNRTRENASGQRENAPIGNGRRGPFKYGERNARHDGALARGDVGEDTNWVIGRVRLSHLVGTRLYMPGTRCLVLAWHLPFPHPPGHSSRNTPRTSRGVDGRREKLSVGENERRR